MTTNFSWAAAALLGLLGATGCGASTATPDDLARAVVGFLAANDFDGYLNETVVSTAQGLEVCPGAKSFSVDVSKFRESFDNCRKGFDFEGASVTTVSPKLETLGAGNKDCGNSKPVNTAEKIEVTVEGPAGKYEFRIDESAETPEGWRQFDHLRCAGVTPSCDKYILSAQTCCDKPTSDPDTCLSLLDTLQAAKDAASQLGTDCGTATFTCPW